MLIILFIDLCLENKVMLSHSHTIATTSRRPMTTDNHRQPSTTNYRPNFRSTIGRRPVADQSPTNCQSLADRTPSEFRIIIKIWKPIGDWLSQNQRLVGNHSAIGRRPFCIRGTKAWQMYAYQPETSVVSLAVQGIIRIANEESNCILPWTYYKWTLIVTLMNSCTCLCQKYHNDILNMPPRFDVNDRHRHFSRIETRQCSAKSINLMRRRKLFA